MDKETLLRFINTLMERHSSDVSAIRQLRDILREQCAPTEFIQLLEIADNANTDVRKVMEEKNSDVTEEVLREAERRHRKFLEENAGRC